MGTAVPPVAGPGFVAVFFDVPFPISIPNGTYVVHDPQKEIAAVTVTLREGSRAFFRSRPIVGPTSFEQLRGAWQEPDRPRENRSYMAVSQLHDGQSKATLNVHCGLDGGYAECKYYSEVCVTFLADDLAAIVQEGWIMRRACEILNPFLDKYRLLNEDYRVSGVSLERNFYFASCHTSPLTDEELALSNQQLFARLETPREFLRELGGGAANVLRTNSFELLGPRNPLQGDVLQIFNQFVQEAYELTLSYDLVLESLRYLQKFREYRLAVVHAETAFEVHVAHLLVALLVRSGMTQAQAMSQIENGRDFWGAKNKIRRLDDQTQQYCNEVGAPYSQFVGSTLYGRWETDLYDKRNAAVHAGANAFTYNEASTAIGIAKEVIVFLEGRVPGLQNRVQLNPSMAGFRQTAGEVMF
jgi:hypothetical protein